ncbi:MAG: DUF692 domain-containing protein [Xanthomonadales bacterium]|nr:DUF692 domain-containing protein [Xanthomonadales bacterium]
MPVRAGIGFKPQHLRALLDDPAPPGFVEVHAENYLGAGGLPHRQLAAVGERLPLSVHGVGLSIGGMDPPDRAHLARLRGLLARHPAAQFSEHLAWSSHGGIHYPDLLPLRDDAATLARVCAHVAQAQEALARRILLENPSTYVAFAGGDHDEPGFLHAVVQRTGCGLLLDVNNAYVSCRNHRRDVRAYLAALPLHAVGEVHLAGHAVVADADGGELLIDDHGSQVADAVWALYREVLARIGPMPTLIEWDTDVPDYPVLRAQAAIADACLRDTLLASAA